MKPNASHWIASIQRGLKHQVCVRFQINTVSSPFNGQSTAEWNFLRHLCRNYLVERIFAIKSSFLALNICDAQQLTCAWTEIIILPRSYISPCCTMNGVCGVELLYVFSLLLTFISFQFVWASVYSCKDSQPCASAGDNTYVWVPHFLYAILIVFVTWRVPSVDYCHYCHRHYCHRWP